MQHNKVPGAVFQFMSTLVFGLALCGVALAAPGSDKVLYSFQGGDADGDIPIGTLIADSAGNLYGVTEGGGGSGCAIGLCGIVFELSPPANGGAWTETVLHIFQGVAGQDGAQPGGGMVLDQAGNLYGSTGYGGSGNCAPFGQNWGCGTIFELTPPSTPGGAWTESIIYSFQGNQDGFFPIGDLTLDGARNLYGSTIAGGGKGCVPDYCGTVFKLSPPKGRSGKWKESILYSFQGGPDGNGPDGALVFDKHGAIYGATYYGGDSVCKDDGGVGCGTAFKLIPSGSGKPWTKKILHTFTTLDGTDSHVGCGLILDAAGNLWGDTEGGGKHDGGTVFELSPPRQHVHPWKLTVLHDFSSISGDPWFPIGGIIFDGSANVYGTVEFGNRHNGGAVFRLSPPLHGHHWRFTNLHDFTDIPDGAAPIAKMLLLGGKLYGTTTVGGTGGGCGRAGCGTVFRLTP
jgi:hypothetical protein